MSTLEQDQRWCVLCSLTFSGVYWQAIAYHQQPFFLPPHTYTHIHIFLPFLSPSLSWPFCLPFKYIPTTRHPTLSLSMCLHLHFLASFPSHPVWSLRQLEIQRGAFFGQPRGNGSERGAQVRLQLLIKNLHCPAWRDVRNDFGFDLSKSLYVTCTGLYEDISYCKSAHTYSLDRIRKMKLAVQYTPVKICKRGQMELKTQYTTKYPMLKLLYLLWLSATHSPPRYIKPFCRPWITFCGNATEHLLSTAFYIFMWL